jgi:hypothetical protein
MDRGKIAAEYLKKDITQEGLITKMVSLVRTGTLN